MTELIQFFAVLLAAFGAVSLGWLALWRGRVVIEDLGLTEEGRALARLLAAEGGVSFTGDLPDRI